MELPSKLTTRQVYPTFHVSLIRAHIPNDDERFPHRDAKSYYDFRAVDEPKWFVNEILAHLEFQVCWMLGDIMWEPLTDARSLKH